MAAPKENLLSLGNLTSTEQNTFTKQRELYTTKSVNRPMMVQTNFSTLQSQHLKKMHLQQRWQELKERECAAQQHNRQLLLQFEKAQETLNEMLVRNAAMKTIRVEYERYLVESSPRWQQQYEEKTQTAQKKCLQQRIEDCLRSYRKIIEDELATKSSADQPSLSQGATTRPQKIAAPQAYSSQEHSNYNLNGFSHVPYTQSSPLSHSQSHTGRFPIRVPFQPHTSSQATPSFLQHPHPFPLHHLTPTPGHHHHPWLRQDPPGWASPQPDYPWSWTAGAAGIPSGPDALWGQIYTEEPPSESRVSQTAGEDKMSRAPSSKAERGGGSRSSHLSQELDVKPVRLSSGQAESSESGRDSSRASRETRKRREKRGRTQRSSSDRERCSSQESSRTSSAIVIASAAVAQNPESDASSEKDYHNNSSRRTRRSGGLTVESPRSEKIAKERTSNKADDSESQHTGEELGSSNEESKRENLGNQSHDDKSESCKEESGSQRDEESGSESVKIENGDADEHVKESSSSEESSAEEKDKGERKKILVATEDDGDEENSQRDEQQEDRNMEGDDEQVCARNKTTEEEEAAEEEMQDQEDDEESNSLKKKGGENIKQDSTSSSQEEEEEEEDESEGSEDKIEEDKEESDEDEDGSEGVEDSLGEDEEGSNKEEDGESEDEEEHRRDEEGKPEDRDSDDSIICPQEKRPIQVQVIPEEAAEDDGDDDDGDKEEEEKSQTGSSNDDSNEFSDEDIEDLLAPQEQTKDEKDPKTEEKPKAFPDSMKIFQVERDTSKTNHPNNSDEFDDFYD